ncbi:MAG: hypothetical protein PVH62_02800 [Anaerolineae bacterium]|jgi:hypothetical protein
MRPLLLLLLVSITACSSAVSPSRLPSASAEPTYTGLGLNALHAYQATLELRFEGDFQWAYHLTTRANGDVVEHRLHLEGVTGARNPGDVRVVMEGDTVKMRGSGTDGECWQFPRDLDLTPAFLTPDDLIDPEGFEDPFVNLGAETIAGVEVAHYALSQAKLGDWRDVEVDLWLDVVTDAALRYDLRAVGPDPLFGTDEGVLSGRFLVGEVGPQMIEPVEGCEIDLPLPPNATRLTKLPGGLVTFESVSRPAEIVGFYQAELPLAGWEAIAQPEGGAESILLSYRRGGQRLEINVEMGGERAYVELFVGEE